MNMQFGVESAHCEKCDTHSANESDFCLHCNQQGEVLCNDCCNCEEDNV